MIILFCRRGSTCEFDIIFERSIVSLSNGDTLFTATGSLHSAVCSRSKWKGFLQGTYAMQSSYAG